MNNDKLKATISELEQQLQTLDNVNDATRLSLQNAVNELRLAVSDEARTDVDRQTVMEQLTDSVEQFEVSHPTLTILLGRLGDMLGQMGV